jgi:hypothetical protein
MTLTAKSTTTNPNHAAMSCVRVTLFNMLSVLCRCLRGWIDLVAEHPLERRWVQL